MKFEKIYTLVLAGILILSCASDCEEGAPPPLSLNVAWVDASGKDLYFAGIYETDSIKGFYYSASRRKIEVPLSVKALSEDSTNYYVNAMPLVRKAYDLQLDTVYISPKSTVVDTVVAAVSSVEDPCYSTIYRFDLLTYNGKPLSGVDTLYRIEK